MKLQIINNDDESIDGFVSLKITENPVASLSQIINNSCTEMLLLDIVNGLDYDESLQFLLGVLQKIRLNGSILIRGISSLALSHAIFNESVDSKQASDTISKIKSIHDQRDIIHLLEVNNFTIDTIRLQGVAYEIKATRHTNVS